MTFSQLRKKDVICVSDGRLVGRVTDLELDERSGQIRALIVPGVAGFSGFFHGDKGQTAIPFMQVACIGDDVILVSASACGCR